MLETQHRRSKTPGNVIEALQDIDRPYIERPDIRPPHPCAWVELRKGAQQLPLLLEGDRVLEPRQR
ncbi:hypothetical protein H1V43_32575 [Streptomyces sp. PSKA54]|uniref:Uncharacterized protein n=1 Tax=Streptomyces himalayensis subsp. aureolus TaxID=2758039 RepID=A0A7W2HJC2_9ACTN|nr:hypothetical protein [Streptomyces himalayensis]MBA4865995.1 hypothetical protein [Streptomyces himalayensis subsp. aureolus]